MLALISLQVSLVHIKWASLSSITVSISAFTQPNHDLFHLQCMQVIT